VCVLAVGLLSLCRRGSTALLSVRVCVGGGPPFALPEGVCSRVPSEPYHSNWHYSPQYMSLSLRQTNVTYSVCFAMTLQVPTTGSHPRRPLKPIGHVPSQRPLLQFARGILSSAS